MNHRRNIFALVYVLSLRGLEGFMFEIGYGRNTEQLKMTLFGYL
jgi:hypothetical protein